MYIAELQIQGALNDVTSAPSTLHACHGVARTCRKRTTTQLQCKLSTVNATSNNNNKCVVSRVHLRAWQLLPVLFCCCMAHCHGAVPLSCLVLSTRKKGAPAPTSLKSVHNKTDRPPLPCQCATMCLPSRRRQPTFHNWHQSTALPCLSASPHRRPFFSPQ